MLGIGILLMPSTVARAEFRTLAPGYHQRDWLMHTPAAATEPYTLEGANVVLPDGRLLMNLNRSRQPYAFQPWHTAVSQGKPFVTHPRSYGGRSAPLIGAWAEIGAKLYAGLQDDGGSSPRSEIFEVDPRTGDAVRRVPVTWPDPFYYLVEDPLTHGVLLITCVRYDGCDERGYHLVSLDLRTGKTTVILRRVTGIGPNGAGYYPFAPAVSPDGQQIFVSHVEEGIDVYDRRTGVLTQHIPTSVFANFPTFGSQRGCFRNDLLYQMIDGSIWMVDRRNRANITSRLLTTGNGWGQGGGQLTFDNQGRLVVPHETVAEGAVTVIDCKPIPVPKRPPGAPEPKSPPAPHAADTPRNLAGPRRQVAEGIAPAAPPGPPPPAPPTGLQTAAQPLTQAASAGQSVTAPQAGLADQEQDVPQLSFSARRHDDGGPSSLVPWSVALMATAALTCHHRRTTRQQEEPCAHDRSTG